MHTVKQKYDYNYWLTQLIDLGQKRAGVTYTDWDKQKLDQNWRRQPLTKLVQQVQYRRNQSHPSPLSL